MKLSRFFVTSWAIAAAVSCSRSHQETRPGAPAKVEKADRGPRNPNVFAADGMCSDKLVKHFESSKKTLTKIMGTLRTRQRDYKQARASVKYSWYAEKTNAEERAADDLMYTFSFWRDVYTPFHQRYGDFWCLRRRDMMVLSTADLESGIDEIWETVKHLGPLPPARNFVIED